MVRAESTDKKILIGAWRTQGRNRNWSRNRSRISATVLDDGPDSDADTDSDPDIRAYGAHFAGSLVSFCWT